MTDDIFECVDPNGAPFSKTNNFVDKNWAMKKIKALEEENARLREAVKNAYYEGWQDNASREYSRQENQKDYETSEARAAIREGGKE